MHTRDIYQQKQVAKYFGIKPQVTGNIKYRNKLRTMAIKKIQGHTIADIGCGNGLLLKKIHNRNLIGIDFSEEMLKEAKKRQPNAEYIQADATNLPLKDNEVDTAICIDMLHHLQPREQFLAIKELLRISKNRVIIEVKVKDSLSPVRKIAHKTMTFFSPKRNIKNTPLRGIDYHNTPMHHLKKILSHHQYKIQQISPAVGWRLITIKVRK